MKKLLAATLALGMLAGCAHPSTMSLRTSQPTSEFRSDGVSTRTVLVSFKKKALPRDFHDLKFTHAIPQIGVAAVTIPQGETPESMIAKLSRDSLVASVGTNQRVSAEAVSVNDPLRGKQYALDKVEAEKAWGKTMGEGVVIAILDTGVDLNHPDLAPNLLPGLNVLDKSALPLDDNGHGTHVAGIAAACADNQVGIAGLAPKAKILPVRIMGKQAGGETYGLEADTIEGIVWAVDHGADVINLSLSQNNSSQALEMAVNYALSKNAVVVAAMGNEKSYSKRYPAAYPGVIAVGNSDRYDRRASVSNMGSWISVVAPGEGILSTFPTYPVTYTPRASDAPAGYASMSGTSMACPLVSGLVALIRSRKKNATPAEVKDILQKSADNLGSTGFNIYDGYGRINAAKALNL